MGDNVGTVVGFGSQLRHLVDALAMSLDVPFMEDFVSGMRLTFRSTKIACIYYFFSDSLQLLYVYFLFLLFSEQLKSSAIVSPLTVLECLLKDLCFLRVHICELTYYLL